MEKPNPTTDGTSKETLTKPDTAKGNSTAPEQKGLFDMPILQVKRIMKRVFPEKAMVSKGAVDIVSRASTLFILYIADLTVEIAYSNRRVIANGNDLIEALKKSGFEEMVGSVKKAMDEQTEHLKELNAIKKQKLASTDPAQETKTEVKDNK